MTDLIQVRRGTSAQWAAANPVLAEGEPGFDTTTGDLRIGDGVTVWSSLSSPIDSRYVTVPTVWTAVTFANAWVDSGGATQTCQYRMVGDTVQLRGAMKTGTIGLAAFTLPAGFRSPATSYFGCVSNNVFGYFTVASSGIVTPAAGSNAYFSIECQFSTVA